MYKKNAVYFLITLLLITISSLCNNLLKSPVQAAHTLNSSKMDFIAFPPKGDQNKISPLIPSFATILSKIKANEKKETVPQVKNPEKPLQEKIILATIPNIAIKIGDNGASVVHIQHRLNEYGYTLVEDGLFSALTYDALLNFQFRCNLDIDGIVGDKTLEKLNIIPTKNIEFNTKRTATSKIKDSTSTTALSNNKSIKELEESLNAFKITSSTNYYIDVDLLKQRVNIFTKLEGVWILDRSLICSTGKASTPTVKGNFTIKDKGPMFRAGSNTICNYYTQFYGNYLFHTVLLDNKGNIQDGRLGIPLSHGCIRLSIEDAKYIYTTISYDTKVSIH